MLPMKDRLNFDIIFQENGSVAIHDSFNKFGSRDDYSTMQPKNLSLNFKIKVNLAAIFGILLLIQRCKLTLRCS